MRHGQPKTTIRKSRAGKTEIVTLYCVRFRVCLFLLAHDFGTQFHCL